MQTSLFSGPIYIQSIGCWFASAWCSCHHHESRSGRSLCRTSISRCCSGCTICICRVNEQTPARECNRTIKPLTASGLINATFQNIRSSILTHTRTPQTMFSMLCAHAYMYNHRVHHIGAPRHDQPYQYDEYAKPQAC